MARLEPWRFHSVLRVHPKFNHVQKNLKQRLVLVIAAGCRERHRGFAVFGDKCRAERYAWTFAAGQFVRMTGHEKKALCALRKRDAGIARDHRWKPGARGSCGKHDAILVNG